MLKKLPKLNFQLKNPLKKMSKKKKSLLAAAGIVIIAGVAVLIFVNSKKNQMKDFRNLSFTVETAKIERQTLANSISATGTVASAETKTVNTSLKDIEIVAVYVKEGDYVNEGDIICEFDSSDYEKALAEAQHNKSINDQIDALNEANKEDTSLENAFDSLSNSSESKDDAEDNLSKAKSKLNSAKAKYDAIADELNSYPDNNILKTCEDEYNSAVDELSRANADLSVSEKELENATADNKEAKEAYENAQSTYSSAQSEVNAAEKDLKESEKTLEQKEKDLESAWESYDEAVEKSELQAQKDALEDQLISQSQEEKTIEQYSELIEDCVVKATMSGVITSLNVTEGNIFEGGNIYTIQDNEHFIVTSSVDEYDISSIEKGMPAYIKTDATGDVEMTGEVTYVAIAPTSSGGSMGAISNSASYTIKVTIDEADKNIRAGMTAKISISLEESADTLTVPYDAVTTLPNGTSTITVDANGEKKTIVVETGLETDYYTEIISDEITEGMTVYLTTPMVTNMPSGSRDEDSNFMDGFFNGGGMPSGGPGGF